MTTSKLKAWRRSTGTRLPCRNGSEVDECLIAMASTFKQDAKYHLNHIDRYCKPGLNKIVKSLGIFDTRNSHKAGEAPHNPHQDKTAIQSNQPAESNRSKTLHLLHKARQARGLGFRPPTADTSEDPGLSAHVWPRKL